MSSLVILAIVLGALLFITGAYWIGINYLFHEEPRGEEIHTVTTEDGWGIQVRRYTPIGGAGEPVLLCHGAFGNSHNLTEPPGESLTDTLVEKGYDCWLVDFRGTRSSRPPAGTSRYAATLDGYLMQDIPAVLGYILETTGYQKVHWVGHSLGGTLLHAFALTHDAPAVLASGTTLGTPPGFEGVKGLRLGPVLLAVRLMPRVSEFFLRCVTPWIPRIRLNLISSPFNWANMHPAIGSRTFFNMMELLPPRVAADLVYGYTHNSLPVMHGEVDVFARLAEVDVPLFALYGARDRLTPEQNIRRFHESLSETETTYVILSEANGYSADYNHVDLAFGRNGRQEVDEPIVEWLAMHSFAKTARKSGAAAKTKSKAARKESPASRAQTPAAAEEASADEVSTEEEASWVKALGKAAAVMDEFEEPAAASGKAREPRSFSPARKRAEAKQISFKSRGKGTQAVHDLTEADSPAADRGETPANTEATAKATSSKTKSTAKKKTAAAKKKTKSGSGQAKKKTAAKSTKKAASAKKSAAKKGGAKKTAAKKKASAKKSAAKKSTAKKSSTSKSATAKKSTKSKSTAKKKKTTTKKSSASKPKPKSKGSTKRKK